MYLRNKCNTEVHCCIAASLVVPGNIYLLGSHICEVRTAGPPCVLPCIWLWLCLFPVSEGWKAIPVHPGRCIFATRNNLLFKVPNTVIASTTAVGNAQYFKLPKMKSVTLRLNMSLAVKLYSSAFETSGSWSFPLLARQQYSDFSSKQVLV